MAPRNWPPTYIGTRPQEIFPNTAKASVTAGFRCDLLAAAEQYTPTKTPIAQPKLMTIHPLLYPLDFCRTTLLTTPCPRIMTIPVPMNSPQKGDIGYFFLRLIFVSAMLGQ